MEATVLSIDVAKCSPQWIFSSGDFGIEGRESVGRKRGRQGRDLIER
jgi:hypothetical protein